VYRATLGRRLVHAADEYYLMSGRPFPTAEHYEGFPMHEDGIGMARTFELEFRGQVDHAVGVQRGFFAAVDAPPNPAAYTGLRAAPPAGPVPVSLGPARASRPDPASRVDGAAPGRPVPVGILTGELGSAVISPLVAELDRRDVRVIPVVNEFFGGNTGVTGLMVGADVARTLAGEPGGHRYLLPDVCLSDDGRFLDGHTVADLPRPVEVVKTDGHALRHALTPHRSGRSRSHSPNWAGPLPDAGNDAAQVETGARA
jgi:hypothetical protein